MIGTTVRHYKILDQIGAGGMGVVYKAQDSKLRRTVALKFLPAGSTNDSTARKRFVREAQAASALQHHSICTIYEIGETEDGRAFICMEYCDGETLAERMSRGPLPIDEALNIVIHAFHATQIAF